LETVVLERDIPERGLRRGDLRAGVELYEPDGLDVDFVRASGNTPALMTLKTRAVLGVRDEDLVSVRSGVSPSSTIYNGRAERTTIQRICKEHKTCS
jgi:hypothetical protein